MTAKPPTQKQIIVLREIAAGNVNMQNFGYAAYRIVGASPQVVGRLVALRWARWPKGPIGEQACELTAQGRAVLAQS